MFKRFTLFPERSIPSLLLKKRSDQKNIATQSPLILNRTEIPHSTVENSSLSINGSVVANFQKALVQRNADAAWSAFKYLMDNKLESKLTANQLSRLLQLLNGFKGRSGEIQQRCAQVVFCIDQLDAKSMFKNARDYSPLVSHCVNRGLVGEAKSLIVERVDGG
ncbi:hypothetical protein K7432_017076, partial [Basidiobolus ranarum]